MMVATRSRRDRKDVSYKFEDFDNMIKVAIEDDAPVVEVEEEPCPVVPDSPEDFLVKQREAEAAEPTVISAAVSKLASTL